MFWAEEALALLFALPTSVPELFAKIEGVAGPLMGALTRKLSEQDHFWRSHEGKQGAPRNGSHADRRRQALGRELAEALLAMSDTDGDGLASFDDLKVAMAQPGVMSSKLVPACWRAGGWLGVLREGNTSLAAGGPRLTADQLAAVDFGARLQSLQTAYARSKPFHFWHNSYGLAQSLSAGSLLYARAALCCLRCEDKQAGSCRQCTAFTRRS